mgnify:CR=1 FL=1
MILPATLVIGVGTSRCLPRATCTYLFDFGLLSRERIPFGELPSRGGPTGRDQFSEKGELCWRQRSRPQGEQGLTKTLSPFKGSRTGNSVSDLRQRETQRNQPVLVARY